VKLVLRVVVMVVGAMSVMMMVAVVVEINHQKSSYTPITTNTKNNTTKHAINYF
jgi:hypothetical protein